MKLFYPLIGLLIISGCAQTTPKIEKSKVNIRPFTIQETENCHKYGIEAQGLFTMLRDGFPYEMTKSVFKTKEHAKGFTLKQLEQLNEIKKSKNHASVIGGYFQSQCLSNLLNIPTPKFTQVSGSFKQCDSLTNPNEVMQCATVQTARAAKKML